MALTYSRYTALVFAVGLGIGEAVINWGHWQWWPLWVVDYAIVVSLLYGFVVSRNPARAYVLSTGWAFALGVFYMALFVTLENVRAGTVQFAERRVIIILIAILTVLAAAGMFTAIVAQKRATAGTWK